MKAANTSGNDRIWPLGRALAMLALAGLLTGCGGGSNKNDLTQNRSGLDDPNRFLEYFDPQAQLAGGSYRVTATRAAAGTTQAFKLEIDLASGAYIERNGQWNSSQTDVNFNFSLSEFGGATIRLSSSADSSLTLTHIDTAAVVSTVDDGGAGVTEKLTFLRSEVDSTRYASAYYDTIDPLVERRTLAGWKEASGFNDCVNPIIEVKFRDTKDLGYGRHMRACTETPSGGFAYFVDNYQVDPIPEIAYSELNLEAVLEEKIRWNIGTNAIEFSPPLDATGNPVTTDASGNPVMIAKFFTFEPRTAGSDGQRDLRLQADLDSRGNKAMPMICVQCHGGRLLPLNPDGTFPRLRTDDNLGVPGGVEAKLQALEVDTFDFPDSGPFTRARQEEKLRKINESVYDSYTDPARMGDYGESGEWDPSFVVDLLDGWYGGDISVAGAKFDQSYVPPGWEPDPATGNPPVGADDLFREVISPRCVVCHGKRGSLSLQSDINFSTYQKFIDHADQLEELIFDEGLMPAARVEFEAMWQGGQSDDEAAMIGSFLPDFSHGNADGSIDRPGAAHADAGPDRTVSGLPATLSAEDSFYASTYEWTLVSAPAGAQLKGANTARATLAGTGGDDDYVVQLTVTDGTGNRESDSVTITVDSTMMITGLGNVPAPRDLRFETSGAVTVSDILQNGAGGQACTNCHAPEASAASPRPGIPMWWTAGTDQTPAGATTTTPALYDRAMARVNLRDPNTSLILRKPSGNHHNGALITGFDTDGAAADHLAYDMFYTWIVEGAPR